MDRRILSRTLLVLSVVLPAAGRAAAGGDADVHVTRCRVKLIDHALLASELSGVVDFVTPSEGDRVAAGEVVAGLRDDIAAAALAAAEKQAEDDTNVRYGDAAARLADHEYRTGQELFRRGALTDAELRRLELEADRGRLQAEKARFDQEVQRLTRDEKAAQLKAYSIQAPPFDGFVTRVFKSAGEAVREGDPVLEVVSTARLRVEGYLSVRDLGRVRQGDRVVVRAEGDDLPPVTARQTFVGRLAFIDASVEPNTRSVRVWAEVANPDGLLYPGLMADMTIESGSSGSTGPTAAN